METKFIEYGMGLRAVSLGDAFAPVVEAAQQQMRIGSNFTRPAKIEVEYPEELLQVLTNADMVKITTIWKAQRNCSRNIPGASHA